MIWIIQISLDTLKNPYPLPLFFWTRKAREFCLKNTIFNMTLFGHIFAYLQDFSTLRGILDISSSFFFNVPTVIRVSQLGLKLNFHEFYSHPWKCYKCHDWIIKIHPQVVLGFNYKIKIIMSTYLVLQERVNALQYLWEYYKGHKGAAFRNRGNCLGCCFLSHLLGQNSKGWSSFFTIIIAHYPLKFFKDQDYYDIFLSLFYLFIY